MDYLVSAVSDIGIQKSSNQDALMVKTLNTSYGKMAFAVVCDGMGGLANGELASTDTVLSFEKWLTDSLPTIISDNIEDSLIRQQWTDIVLNQNQRIMQYARQRGYNMGTTVVAMLLTDKRVYIMNVGDSRAYLLKYGLNQITKDHTLVAHEVEIGKLTPEQALVDPRRSVLLQCVGASDTVYPGFYFGQIEQDAVYLLCSDGFVHEISEYEIYETLKPNQMTDEQEMENRVRMLIETNKARAERDNISALVIRTF